MEPLKEQPDDPNAYTVDFVEFENLAPCDPDTSKNLEQAD